MTDELAGVQAGYDRWAAIYDHDGNPLQALEGPALQAAVNQFAVGLAGRAALDLGCGTARHALWLAEAGFDVTAVDFSEGMLATARRKPGAERIRFLAHDLGQPLPFAGGSFDLVVSGLVLEHLRDLEGFFAEVRRMLRVGGHAVVTTMHPAMFLRGAQARFTDADTGEVVAPGSLPHSVAAIALAAFRSGLEVRDLTETAPDGGLAERFPRAARYVGWPMLVLLSLKKSR